MHQTSASSNLDRQTLEVFKTYREAREVSTVNRIYDENVNRLVNKIVALVEPFDAFDLIDLMRLRELPPIPDPRSSKMEGSALNIEIVTAVLLSRRGREGTSTQDSGMPSVIVEELHGLTSALWKHAFASSMVIAEKDNRSNSETLALYQTSRAMISNFQFDEIRDRHDNKLLNHEISKPMLLDTLGYSLEDVKSVRDAIQSVYSRRFTDTLDKVGDGIQELMEKYGDVHSGSAEENQKIKDAVVPMMFRPSSRASMTVSDIADQVDIPEDRIEKVINDFSVEFDQTRDATVNVKRLMRADWTLVYKPLARSSTGEFVTVANGLGDDTIRRVFEEKLKNNTKRFQKYDQKVRARVTEDLAIAYLSNLIKPDSRWANIKYACQINPGIGEDLDSSFAFDRSKCRIAESDGLFLIDDVAVVVEVKGKAISDRARTGDIQRFDRDLRDTIGDAKHQTERLTNLIRNNSGIWLESGKWVDCRHVSTVFKIVVLLDDVGPVGIQPQREADPEKRADWVVSLHDLAVMSALFKSPTEFLGYLKCRSEALYGYEIIAFDELDILTGFLSGELFKKTQVAGIFRRVPILAPTNGPIDVWMNRHETESVPRPRVTIEPKSAGLIRELVFRSQRGYMSVSLDLLLAALSADSDVETMLSDLHRTDVAVESSSNLSVPAVNGSPEIVLVKAGKDINILELRMEARRIENSKENRRLFIYLNSDNELQSFLRA